MRAYIASLVRDSEHAARRAANEKEERAVAEAAAAREAMTPLDERLRRVLAAIPAEVRHEGLPLAALQVRLQARGKGHTHCHVGELGSALRRLGYIRRRNWRGGKDSPGGFRAFWYPPDRQ